ncbi:MAG: 16S rRNA (adenine(1518)-N(6)/adenine(1519)-N(6))-dimethyltransferase RsmA [Tissierellia bacterium]|nr:16S rRNA (adenine(1518)-N(6)/adenine(1519)-N(6))-dimethyltransferase RsmA [Tissierellia bacterium]
MAGLRLYQPSRVRDLLNTYDFSVKKSLGQNFLIDGNILDKISTATQIGPEDLVLEIGPGLGTLTEEMALKGAQVLAVEVDRTLEPILEETLGGFDRVQVLFQDILKTDIKKEIEDRYGKRPLKVIANLPYYISTPILDHLFKSGLDIEAIYIMVQKELADRIVADSGNKDYGSFSVYVQIRSRARIVTRVPATCFMPKPKVDSAFVELVKKEPPLGLDIDRMEKIVRGAFSKRRKTVLNALSSYGFAIEKEEIQKALALSGIEPSRRAEDIAIEEYILLGQNFPAI